MTERARWLKDVLWGLVFFGAVSIGFRLWYGLGATTNLSDAVPWGLWKIANMVAGVALGTGGFTVAFLVYVAGMERFRPLVKPAVLIAFLAYGSSCFALFLDIGLPHRIWHPIFMWNVHSFLFEVAWCVMLYFTITMLEMAPTILSRFGLSRPAHWLHRATFVIVTVGITLSSLHHTSLGSLFLVTPKRLHPLWYSPRLPLLFILSAMAAGLMVVVLAKLLYARWYDPASIYGGVSQPGATEENPPTGPDFPMVRQLAMIAGGVLVLVVVARVADLVATGAWRSLLAGTWESWFWGLALLLGGVIPIVLLSRARWRSSPGIVGLAAACAVAGLVWNRLNVGIFGYLRGAGRIYVPSLAEWGLSLGVIAAAGLVFFLAVEMLPIFDDRAQRARTQSWAPACDPFSRAWAIGPWSGISRVTLIGVLVVPVSWVALFPPFARASSGPQRVQPPLALNVQRTVLRIDGNRAGLATSFPHADHQKRLGGERSCQVCHHLSWPQDHATPCVRCHTRMERTSRVFDHERHMVLVARRDRLTGLVPGNHSCGACHAAGRPYSKTSAKPCLDCHRDDMHPAHELHPSPSVPGVMAGGYRAAMHGTCLVCHRKEAERQKRPQLAECACCHKSLQPRPARTASLAPRR